ncbi:MAG: alpha/beta hydrolase [Chitinophagaceae bacterium]|nr:alpha/beta hydrolase [Chitinophagaceae bacterium]MBK9485996.1 alpha/beta hydrolase [Chitinophagaceae bacterium]
MKLTQRLAIGYVQTKFKLLSAISKKKAAEKALVVFGTPFMKSIRKAPIKNAEVIHFQLNNKKMNGYRWNHPQPQKALILHGFGSAAHKFEDYALLLIEKGFEVLAFDAPAHGNSEGDTTNAIEYSEMIQEVMERFGPIENFIAHSFGGISLSLALEQVTHDANTKVVFIAPATETTSAVDGAFKMLKLKNETVRNEFEKIILNLTGKNVAWFSMRRAMDHIKASILWVHDEEDDITPWADALKVKEDNHPNIKFVCTKGLGHRKIYHDDNIKKQVIDFMEKR